MFKGRSCEIVLAVFVQTVNTQNDRNCGHCVTFRRLKERNELDDRQS